MGGEELLHVPLRDEPVRNVVEILIAELEQRPGGAVELGETGADLPEVPHVVSPEPILVGDPCGFVRPVPEKIVQKVKEMLDEIEDTRQEK